MRQLPVAPSPTATGTAGVDVSECEHPHLAAVETIYALYRCLACGHYFNLQLINLVRHTPEDLARVAVHLLHELGITIQAMEREVPIDGVSERGRDPTAPDNPGDNTAAG